MLKRKSLKKIKELKVCPKCGEKGSGLYRKWVLNAYKKKYYPYYYFAHSRHGKIKWCYIKKGIAERII